jgi:hypothetical protein
MLRALALLLLAGQDPPSFGKEARLVAAYYRFGEPLPDRDALKRELREMGKAGVDVCLPVGLTGPARALLAEALAELEKEPADAPRAGLVLEASDDPARALAAFREAVPARHRADVDGRPLVWLAPLPPGTRPPERFRERLGPAFVVAEVSWNDAGAERGYAWGAQEGTPRELSVVSVGPGRERDEGRFYDRAWFVALRLEPRMVAIESWNGWPEGSGVAEAPAHGRKYLEATARYVRKFKLNEKMTLPRGKWTGASKALFTLKYNPHEQGLRPVPHEEGRFESIQLRGIAVLSTKANPAGDRRCLSFDVDDSFCFFEKRSFEIEIEFLDAGEGTFRVEYDSGDRSLAPDARPFRSAGEKAFGGTGEWRTEKLDLPDALFGNRQPGGADVRIVLEKRGIAVRRVAILPR